MNRPRDNQRKRLYDAEWSVEVGQQFKTVQECQRYVDGILTTDWWQQRFPETVAIEVRDGRGRRRAAGNRIYIILPMWARNEITILHELAHSVQTRGSAAHGPEYARILLELVNRFGPALQGRDLAKAFREKRVKLAPLAACEPRMSAQQARRLRGLRSEAKQINARLAEIRKEIQDITVIGRITREVEVIPSLPRYDR